MIDLKAPIIPFKEMGRIKLYSTIDELQPILSDEKTTRTILNEEWTRYDIGKSLMLFFHEKNKKLFKICTQEEYQGSLPNGISVGTDEKEFSILDETLSYDDFDEVWESELGYFVETDAETNKAVWISIFIKELLSKDFDLCNW